ncbi:uncharacterized protein LOC106133132 [Amyelois transitella]|uniref:uncharacterized protein LOC106133132 n=1 Tax=Amyelois transitella TaxID=680683 RepID=UPI00067B5A90|nr:uncharacterized protein LOC106133132 [Amyelois transitella]
MADQTESGAPPGFTTVSSLKSDHSTEQLICKTPQKVKSVSSKSVASERNGRRRIVVFLGLGQVVLGALLLGAGAMAVVKGAALSRVGAGLWAGCAAVVAGVVGVLAGINDCYGLHGGPAGGGPLLTAFLALSLLCLASGHSAAVLAATGLQRDSSRQPPTLNTFQDEMEAWSPVLANIAVLIIATAHCVLCAVSIYHAARRVCPCFKAKQAFDHNQFDPGKPFVIHVEDKEKVGELCKDLEGKLQADSTAVKKKKETPEPAGEFGSANSKEKLVSHWLGRQTGTLPPAAQGAKRRGVRKPRKPPPLMLLPAHHATTLGRMPVSVMMPPAPRYATLPLPPPAHYAHAPPHAPIYYPVHDPRMRRRRSPRSPRHERRRSHARGRERDSQLTRSLERIHRKRRAERERMTDADLKRTYTGLDRAYAEQFIAVIDETRHAAEHHDSLTSTSCGSSPSHSHEDL